MKFFAYAALIATASTVRITSSQFEAPVMDQALVQTAASLGTEMPLDEMFEAIDKNGDGFLTMKEIMGVIKKYCTPENHCTPPPRKLVKQIFDHVDTNGDKKISPDEIKAAIFDAVDTDNSGSWSLTEVKEGIQAMAHATHQTLIANWETVVTEAFNHVDTDNNGQVSPKELEAAIKKYGYPDFSDLME